MQAALRPGTRIMREQGPLLGRGPSWLCVYEVDADHDLEKEAEPSAGGQQGGRCLGFNTGGMVGRHFLDTHRLVLFLSYHVLISTSSPRIILVT